METRTKIIITLVALTASFAVGRYTVPTKTITQIVEVEKKVVEKEKHKKTISREVIKPDGTKETIIEIVEDSNTTIDSSKSASNTTETTRSGSRVTVSGLAASKVSNITQPVFGAQVTKDILGPINAGVFGFSDGTIGVSLGLTF